MAETKAKPEGDFKMKDQGLAVKPAPAKRTGDDILKIKWLNKRVKVLDLKDYDRNPRTISEAAFRRLKKSLRDTGYHTPILAQPDLRVVGGHQRRRALLELGVAEIDVRVPERTLSDDEFKQVLIQSNISSGKWDADILGADFEIEDLTGWGMNAALVDMGDAPLEEDEAGSGLPDAPACPHCGQPMKA